MKSLYQFFKDQDSIKNFKDCEDPAYYHLCHLEHKYIDIPDDELYIGEYEFRRTELEDVENLIFPKLGYSSEEPDFKKRIILQLKEKRYFFSKQVNNEVLNEIYHTMEYYQGLGLHEICTYALKKIHEKIDKRIKLENQNLDIEEYFFAVNSDRYIFPMDFFEPNSDD